MQEEIKEADLLHRNLVKLHDFIKSTLAGTIKIEENKESKEKIQLPLKELSKFFSVYLEEGDEEEDTNTRYTALTNDMALWLIRGKNLYLIHIP
mmetsp:Transcript_1588/g.1399  ORF Transcript_1588/g.1399 Transcript_1588/m.1399 type:complete len:94 (+) Transcript_1588:40-321(+)